MRHSTHTREYGTLLRLLKATREEAGVTQVQLADQLGISQSHLSKLERGEIRIDLVQLRHLCTLLVSSLPAFVSRWEDELAKKSSNRKTK